VVGLEEVYNYGLSTEKTSSNPGFHTIKKYHIVLQVTCSVTARRYDIPIGEREINHLDNPSIYRS
jgi:hypothetical protein